MTIYENFTIDLFSGYTVDVKQSQVNKIKLEAGEKKTIERFFGKEAGSR